MLEIRNLHASVEGKRDPQGHRPRRQRRRGPRHHGAQRLGQEHAGQVLAGREDYEVTEGEVALRGPRPARAGARGARPRGHLPGLPVPGGDPRRQQRLLPAGRAERDAQAPGRGGARRHGLPGPGAGEDEAGRDGRELAATAPVNEGFSGGEKKRNEILQMAVLEPQAGDPGRDRLRPGHRRPADRRRRRERAARRRSRDRRGHPLPAPAGLHRARLRPRAGRGTHRSFGRAGLALELEEKGYGWLDENGGDARPAG